MDYVVSFLEKIIALNPFSSATWFVIAIIIFFTWLFLKANNDPKNPVRWEHLIIDSTTNRTSPYKLGYLVGAIVSTWVVITLMDRDKLSIDVFGAYLTYLVGGASFTEWLKHGKHNNHPEHLEKFEETNYERIDDIQQSEEKIAERKIRKK